MNIQMVPCGHFIAQAAPAKCYFNGETDWPILWIQIKVNWGQPINPHYMDAPIAVSDIFVNIFTESCSEGPNNQFALNLLNREAGFSEAIPILDEQIQDKLIAVLYKSAKYNVDDHYYMYFISIQ